MGSRNIKLSLLQDEFWWGGAVFDGTSMPYGKEIFKRSLDPNETYNQSSPILIWSKGRFSNPKLMVDKLHELGLMKIGI